MRWTARRDQVMRSAQWALFREGISTLVDQVHDAFTFDNADPVQTGIEAFDRLKPAQQLALLATVGKALSDEHTPAPSLTEHTEAAVAAVFRQLVTDVGLEIDGVFGDGSTDLRSRIVVACQEVMCDLGPESDADGGRPPLPDVTEDDPAVWEDIIMESLAERVLWSDGNYDAGDAFRKVSLKKRREGMAALGIDPNYFAAAPPKPSKAEAERFWREVLQLCGRPVPE